ncbi:hypothetical protein [Streptacidiphilus sp. EB103A]|uniref:hypothetical protein n=1 Tax=Streptacidiphilus sp. EB103A TaxID=3156275 RepID=UPI0035167972
MAKPHQTTPAATDAIRALLHTHDSTALRRAADDSILERARHAYGTAYHLSGGRSDHAHAHDVALVNALHHTAPAVVAFALHHLTQLLPDLTEEQWARLDEAAVELDLQICEDLSGANEPLPHATVQR